MDQNSLQMLKPYMADPAISELMFNAYDRFFIEREGKIQVASSPFQSDTQFESVLDEMAALKSANTGSGFDCDGILPDGSRFHITRPPLSPYGSTLTIRKFGSTYRGLEKLITAGFLSQKCARFLEACVQSRISIVISGSTGAGKTTLLNALCSKVGSAERIITVEDIPEIQLTHPNWVRLVSVRGSKSITTGDCLISSVRMRPDRIVVGECRSNEVVPMLQAMNSGHEGSMTTVHANSSADALTRLESLVMFHSGVEIPIKILRKQIADAIDLIVQVKKSADGKRHVEEVLEVVGMESDVITRQPLFKMSGEKGRGKLLCSGQAPNFLQRFEERKVPLPKDFFNPTAHES